MHLRSRPFLARATATAVVRPNEGSGSITHNTIALNFEFRNLTLPDPCGSVDKGLGRAPHWAWGPSLDFPSDGRATPCGRAWPEASPAAGGAITPPLCPLWLGGESCSRIS